MKRVFVLALLLTGCRSDPFFWAYEDDRVLVVVVEDEIKVVPHDAWDSPWYAIIGGPASEMESLIEFNRAQREAQ